MKEYFDLTLCIAVIETEEADDRIFKKGRNIQSLSTRVLCVNLWDLERNDLLLSHLNYFVATGEL